MLARKFSLTRLKMTGIIGEDDAGSGGMASPTFSSASSPKALNSRGVSFQLPESQGSVRRKGAVEGEGEEEEVGLFASLLGSFFGSPKASAAASSSLPAGGSRSQADDLRSLAVVGRKDFKRWALELPTDLLWGYQTGDGLLAAVRKHLTKKTCEEIIFSSSLTRQEAASIALFTARTGIGATVCEAILEHYDDPGVLCTDSELVMPNLGHAAGHEHAPLLTQLLTALPKLPKISASVARNGPSVSMDAADMVAPQIRFCCIDLEAVHKQNDFNSSSFTLPTILTVSSSMIPEAVCMALGGPSRCRILCIKNISARYLGPLNMAVDPSLDLGEEALLLPGWKGRIVGTLAQKWKKLMRDALAWDVTQYTFMEVVEDTSLDDGSPPAAGATKSGSPTLWRRHEQRQQQQSKGAAVALPSILSPSSPKHNSSSAGGSAFMPPVVQAAALAPTHPLLPHEPFMAKEYLVGVALRFLERRPNDVTWNMHLGLLYAYGGSEEYKKAQSCFEMLLRERSADYGAQLQLGLLYDRHFNQPEKARKMYEGALRVSADNANVYYLLGSLLRRSLSEYSTARRYLEAALKLDPRHVAAHAEYGWILENYVADHAGAEEHYKAAIRMEANHADANYFLGCSRETHHKDYKNARRYFTLSVAADPKHVEGTLRLGQLLDEHYQQYDDAQRHYLAVLALRPNHANAHHLLGFLLLMQRKDPKNAKEHFLAAILSHPEHADAHNHLGHLLWRWENNWTEAAVMFRKAIALQPQHCNAHSNLARGLLEEELAVGEARGHFEVAITLDPDDIYVRAAYATMLLDHRMENRADVQTAFFHLEVVVTKCPSYAQGHLQMGRAILAQHKSASRARVEMEIALELDPSLADAHNELGLLLESKYSEWERAADHLRRAVSLAPRHVTAHNNLGLLLWKHLNDPLHARQEFDAALEVEPLNVQVLKNLAMLLLEQLQDYKRARRHLETVLKVNPNDVDCLTLLGTLLKNKFHDYRKAKYCFESARRVAPKDVTILNELGLLHLRHLHDSVMALELFEEVLTIAPKDGCAQTNIDRIMNYSKRYQERRRLEAEARAANKDHIASRSGSPAHRTKALARRHKTDDNATTLTLGSSVSESANDDDDDGGVLGRSASSLMSFLDEDDMILASGNTDVGDLSHSTSGASQLDAALEFTMSLPVLQR